MQIPQTDISDLGLYPWASRRGEHHTISSHSLGKKKRKGKAQRRELSLTTSANLLRTPYGKPPLPRTCARKRGLGNADLKRLFISRNKPIAAMGNSEEENIALLDRARRGHVVAHFSSICALREAVKL
jgi:hypothetical protein